LGGVITAAWSKGFTDCCKSIDPLNGSPVVLDYHPGILRNSEILQRNLFLRMVADWPPAFAPIVFNPNSEILFDFKLRPGDGGVPDPIGSPAVLHFHQAVGSSVVDPV
jgi:hypothetical protein